MNRHILRWGVCSVAGVFTYSFYVLANNTIIKRFKARYLVCTLFLYLYIYFKLCQWKNSIFSTSFNTTDDYLVVNLYLNGSKVVKK